MRYTIEFRKAGKSYWIYATRTSDAKAIIDTLKSDLKVSHVLCLRDTDKFIDWYRA